MAAMKRAIRTIRFWTIGTEPAENQSKLSGRCAWRAALFHAGYQPQRLVQPRVTVTMSPSLARANNFAAKSSGTPTQPCVA